MSYVQQGLNPAMVGDALIQNIMHFRNSSKIRHYDAAHLEAGQFRNPKFQQLVETTMELLQHRSQQMQVAPATLMAEIVNMTVDISAAMNASRDHYVQQQLDYNEIAIVNQLVSLVKQIDVELDAAKYQAPAGYSGHYGAPVHQPYQPQYAPAPAAGMRPAAAARAKPPASSFFTPMSPQPSGVSATTTAPAPVATAAPAVYVAKTPSQGLSKATYSGGYSDKSYQQPNADIPVTQVGLMYAFNPTTHRSKTIMRHSTLHQIIEELGPMNPENHAIKRTFPKAASIAQRPAPDFFGIYASNRPVVAVTETSDVSALTGDIITSTQRITAMSRKHADVVFKAGLLQADAELTETQCYQYYLLLTNVIHTSKDKESLELRRSTSGIDRLMAGLTPTLEELARAIRDVGQILTEPLNQKVARAVNDRMTIEFNLCLKYRFNLDIQIDSFADDYLDALVALEEENADMYAQVWFPELLPDAFGGVMLDRAMTIIPGADCDDEFLKVIDSYIPTTKKQLGQRSLYTLENYIVVHVPVPVCDLELQLDRDYENLVTPEYLPELYSLIDGVFQREQNNAIFNGNMVLVTDDDVEFDIYATGLPVTAEPDDYRVKYLIARRFK